MLLMFNYHLTNQIAASAEANGCVGHSQADRASRGAG